MSAPQPVPLTDRPLPAAPTHFTVAAGVALLAAGLLIVRQLSESPCISRDGVALLRFASQLDSALDGSNRQLEYLCHVSRRHDQHPLVPMLIALTWRTVGRHVVADDPPAAWAWSGRAVSTAGWAGLLLAVFLLGRRFGGTGPGLASAAAVGLLPDFVFNGTDVMAELPGLALMAGATVLCLRSLEGGGLPTTMLAGTLAGVAFLARPEYLQPALVLGLWRVAQAVTGFGTGVVGGRGGALLHAVVLAHVCAVYVVPMVTLRGSLMTKPKHDDRVREEWLDRTATVTGLAPAAAPVAPAATSPAVPVPHTAPVATKDHPASGKPAPARSAKLPDDPDVRRMLDPRLTADGERPGTLRRLYLGAREFVGRSAQTVRWALLPLTITGTSALLLLRATRADVVFLLGMMAVQAAYLVGGLYMSHGYVAGRHLMPTGAVSAPTAGAGALVLGWLVWELIGVLRGRASTGAVAASAPAGSHPSPSEPTTAPDTVPQETPSQQSGARRTVPLAPAAGWIATAALSVACVVAGWRSADPLNADHAGFREAADWMQRHRIPAIGLLDPQGVAAWYAGLDGVNTWRSAHDLPMTDEYLRSMIGDHSRVGRRRVWIVATTADLARKYRPDGMPGKLGRWTFHRAAAFTSPHGTGSEAQRTVEIWQADVDPATLPPAKGQ